jgi:hypothetical protein
MKARRRHLLVAGLIVVWGAAAWAQPPEPIIEEPGRLEIEPGDLKLRTAEDRILRQIMQETPHRDEALVVGERLVFSVRYGPIRAGEATLEIAEVLDLPQGPAYRLLSTARSNSFFDSFYKVDDHVESHMDVDFLFSRRHEKHLREGKYKQDRTAVLDQENHLAVYSDGRVFEMPPRAHDVLTAFYYVRTMEFEVGDVIRFDSHQDRKNYRLRPLQEEGTPLDLDDQGREENPRSHEERDPGGFHRCPPGAHRRPRLIPTVRLRSGKGK